MKKLSTYLPALLVALVAIFSIYADTAVITETVTVQGPVKLTTFAWTTSTNLCSVSAATTNPLRGEILRVTFKGTTATNDYTVTMTDSNGVDVLMGQGAAIPSNTATTVKPAVKMVGVVATDTAITNIAPVYVNHSLTILVTNAGDNVSGVIDVLTK